MQEPNPREGTIEGWVPVFAATTDYEADIVRDRLGAEGIPAAVHSQRDHVFNLTTGDMARVRVMVPPEHAEAARALAEAPPISAADLEAQAMGADASAPDAYVASFEASLDSGADSISFDVPDDSGAGDAGAGDSAGFDVPATGALDPGTGVPTDRLDDTYTGDVRPGTPPSSSTPGDLL